MHICALFSGFFYRSVFNIVEKKASIRLFERKFQWCDCDIQVYLAELMKWITRKKLYMKF